MEIAEDIDALGMQWLVGYREDLEGYEGERVPDTIEYQLITVYLQQIIKDQQAIIAGLQAENALQAEQIKNLQADVQSIKEYLGIK